MCVAVRPFGKDEATVAIRAIDKPAGIDLQPHARMPERAFVAVAGNPAAGYGAGLRRRRNGIHRRAYSGTNRREKGVAFVEPCVASVETGGACRATGTSGRAGRDGENGRAYPSCTVLPESQTPSRLSGSSNPEARRAQMLHFTRSPAILPLALIAAVAAICLQGAAFAQVPMQPTHRTMELKLNGLDLSSPSDLALLTSRIRIAASTVCKPEDFRDHRAFADRAACQKAAIGAATAQRDGLVAQAQERATRMAANREATPATN